MGLLSLCALEGHGLKIDTCNGFTQDLQEFLGRKDFEVRYNLSTHRYEIWQYVRIRRQSDERRWVKEATFKHWHGGVPYDVAAALGETLEELQAKLDAQDAEIEANWNRFLDDIGHEYKRDLAAHLGHGTIISTPA